METILRLSAGTGVDFGGFWDLFRAVVALQASSSCRICLVRAGFVPELGAPIRKATRRSRGSVSFDSHAVDCFSASGIELGRKNSKSSRSEANSFGGEGLTTSGQGEYSSKGSCSTIFVTHDLMISKRLCPVLFHHTMWATSWRTCGI